MKLRTFVFWAIAVLIGVALLRGIIDGVGWNPFNSVPSVEINK